VWGASYGSVPATIFASFYPKTTNAVIMESPVYSAEAKQPDRRQAIYQELFDALPVTVRKEVIRSVKASILEPAALTQAFYNHLLNFGRANDIFFISRLSKAVEKSEKDGRIQERLKAAFPSARSFNGLPRVEEVVYFHVNMKGFVSKDRPEEARILFDKNKGFISTSPQKSALPELLPHVQMTKSYSAKDYPLSVPVIYLQGEKDVATPKEWANLHYRFSARGPKQMLVFKNLGHKIAITFEGLGRKRSHDLFGFNDLILSVLHRKEVAPDILEKIKNESPIQIAESKASVRSCRIVFAP
jgi:proline iminopeptidase